MSNLPIFSHPSFGTVRIVERNDEPWFVAKDVLKALGYAEDYNPSRALQAVPEEWKGVQPIHTPGGMQEMLIISEQGLYFFLGRSDKPVALPFQKWLAGDVIPSIRKHGLYATEEVVDRILDDPDFGITLLQRYKFEREQRQLAESQRDEAIRTKAWISDKKTASAMATASVAVRKAAALENELGRGRDLTGSTKKPDAQTTDFLRNSPGILWALDFDEAGRKASSWWREHFPGMRTWPCAAGKDPGEMLKVGIPIRPWLEAVLLCEPAPCRETHKNAPQSAERQKHDSGLMPQLEPSANDTLERLAALDTNIAALVGWEVAPHLQDGELVIDGLDRLDAENRAGLERWFAHKGPNGEPRRERVIRALRTGRRAAC